jgi:hypothetical protein
MTDSFKRMNRSLTSPAENAVAILPDDGAVLPQVTRALFVGGAGDARVRMLGGDVVSFASLQAGSLLPIRVVQVLATGTTATGLVGLW